MRGQIGTPLLLFLLFLAETPAQADPLSPNPDNPQPSTLVSQPAQADPLPPSPEAAVAGWIVLRNGNMLQGVVHRTTDHYHVRLKKGSLRISTNQVEMFCRTIQEAYQRRRDLRTGGSADSHLELMRWCLRHQLLEYAARELVDARRIDPSHPSLPMLQRQLQQAFRTTSPDARPKGLNLSAPKHSPVDSSASALRISRTARAEFARRIQPILIQSCSTVGCHDSGSPQKFHLNRHVLAGAGHPEATRRNLASTLAQSAAARPDEMMLLRKARQSHSESQPLSARQIQLLTVWLEKIRYETEKPKTENPEEKEGAERESFWPGGEAFPKREPRPDSIRLQGKPPKVRRGVQLQAVQPRDPFDAETFNRHYEKQTAN